MQNQPRNNGTYQQSRDGEKANILLVDDQPENLLALEAILAGLDQKLVRARSGVEALRSVLRQDFALILMDAEMPDMDGYETARLIRSRERSRYTPIIFLTAVHKTETQIFRGYSVGGVDYMFKPFVPEILRSKVVVFVDLFHKNEEVRRQAEELRRMNGELESANRRMTELYRELQAKNKELQLERDFVSTVLHTAGSLVMILDGDGKIVRFNRFCEQTTGYTFDEVKGKKVWDLLLPPEETAAAIEDFGRVRRSTCISECENTWIARDGTRRFIAWCHTPLIGIEGVAEYVVGTGMDITERKRGEEARALMIREQAARLEAEAAQRRFAFLAEASAALFSSLDPQKIMSSVAHLAVPKMADWCVVYSRSDEKDLIPMEAFHSDPEKQDAARELLRYAPDISQDHNPLCKALRTGHPELLDVVSHEHFDALACDADHHMLLRRLGMSSSIFVPLVARGRTLGVMQLMASDPSRRFGCTDLSLAEDLAQRTAMAVENAQLYHKAQEASNAKDQFLAVVSHELRTPLNSMLGWARLLREGKLDQSSATRAVETIERNARAQAQLIEDILDISRITVGKLRINIRAVEVVPIIEAALDAARPTSELKGITLETALDPSCGRILGDPDRIQQVAWNLLSNAVKFTPAGGRVNIRLEKSGSWIELCVSDNGNGISQEFLPYVFDRFSQAESSSSRSAGGLGLGLSIVRHVVELHGGTIRAHSDGPGRGATFTVSLPAATSQTEAVKSEVAVENPTGSLD
jgi:PAS domain S-box-containing protein